MTISSLINVSARCPLRTRPGQVTDTGADTPPDTLNRNSAVETLRELALAGRRRLAPTRFFFERGEQPRNQCACVTH
jgi:hypothetical protein